MVLGPLEPTAAFLVALRNARIALTGIGLVVTVGEDSLNFRVVHNPLTVNIFRNSIAAPKVCTQCLKFVTKPFDLSVNELHACITAVLESVENTSVKNEDRLNRDSELKGAKQACII